MNDVNFDDFSWHDAELVYIKIDRENDLVKITVRFPETDSDKTIEFVECYGLHAKMNFGFFSPDSILEAKIIATSKEMELIKHNWMQMGLALENLKCYQIVTNTSGSEINIFSNRFLIY